MLKNRFHPGTFLREELQDRGVSQSQLAGHIGVAPGVINLICNGHRAISPEMAKKLAAALGTTAQLWMNLQTSYDLNRVADPRFGKLPA
jgi:HTH-type transcriptional regulator/antitoxin HigA